MQHGTFRRTSNALCTNVLLFGETGSGKSTLINYLTNYFRQGSLDNLKIAIPTKFQQATEGFLWQENDLHDQTKSKTSQCHTYDFVNNDGKHFKFIDTPGLSDTSGIKKDDENIAKIMSAAEVCRDLTAVMIVINGTAARTTVNLQNTLTRMKGAMPDELLNNLIVVLTNCNEDTCTFDLKSLNPWSVAKNNKFYMQNSAFVKHPDEWRDDGRRRGRLQLVFCSNYNLLYN